MKVWFLNTLKLSRFFERDMNPRPHRFWELLMHFMSRSKMFIGISLIKSNDWENAAKTAQTMWGAFYVMFKNVRHFLHKIE